MFLYALFIAGITFAARIGMNDGGRNIFLALIIVAIGWRGILATRVYHEAHNLKTERKRVIAVSALFMVLAILAVVGLTFVLGLARHRFRADKCLDAAASRLTGAPTPATRANYATAFMSRCIRLKARRWAVRRVMYGRDLEA